MKIKLLRLKTARERLILYVMVCFILLYLLTSFIIMPVIEKVSLLNEEIEKKSILLTKYTHLAEKAPAIISLYDNLKQGIKTEVNLQHETNAFLKEIEKNADSSGLIVQGIKPLAPKKGTSHTEIYLEIDCQGDMKSVLNFICGMENTSLLVTIPSLKISPQRNNPNVLSLVLKVYKVVF